MYGFALTWVIWLFLAGGDGRHRDERWAIIVSFASATAFCVHPLTIQGATYVVQRMTSLATLFSLLALGTYLVLRHKSLEGRRPRFG